MYKIYHYKKEMGINMSYKKLFGLCILLFTVTFSGTVGGYISGVHKSKNQKEAPSSEPIVKVKNQNSIVKTYIVKESEGAVNMYLKNTDGSLSLLRRYGDIYVSLLPRHDRDMLKDGISCSNLSEAMQLIEDFSG